MYHGSLNRLSGRHLVHFSHRICTLNALAGLSLKSPHPEHTSHQHLIPVAVRTCTLF